MKYCFVCIVAVLVVACAAGPSGSPKCDAYMISQACAPDAKKRNEEMIKASSMTADCKSKMLATMKSITPQVNQICSGKADVTKTCNDLKQLFETVKNNFNECAMH